VDLGNPTMV